METQHFFVYEPQRTYEKSTTTCLCVQVSVCPCICPTELRPTNHKRCRQESANAMMAYSRSLAIRSGHKVARGSKTWKPLGN